MRRKWAIIILLAILFGCGPYIWFKVPQPKGLENISTFPESLQGEFISLEDTSVIRINKNNIIHEYREKLIMTLEDFRNETGDTIPMDTSFIFEDNWDVTIKSLGDSVMIFSGKDEEMFRISNENLLREYKGYYFLNYKSDNDFWRVKILKFENDTLEFDHILTEEDLVNINRITAIESKRDSVDETTHYYLNPTRRQLRKILKQRLKGEKFVRKN